MKKWLIPGAVALAAVAAIAVAVVLVAPFDSVDSVAKTTADSSAGAKTDDARCTVENGCVDPNGGGPNGVCGVADVPDCNDTAVFLGDACHDNADCDADSSETAVADLSARLGVDPALIVHVSSEPTEWPDACLGVHQPDVLCAQVITYGYRVILEYYGTQYEYRTDGNGTAVAAN